MGHCFSIEAISESANSPIQNIHQFNSTLPKNELTLPPKKSNTEKLISKFQDLQISESITKIALKIPHEWKHQEITKTGIIYQDDINVWLSNLYYNNKFDHYIVYNDQIEHISNKSHHGHHGHSKGILSWNNNHISWLIHSVPNFPELFDGSSISKIRDNEKIYGQSFCYVKFPFTKEIMDSIIMHLNLIDPNIYIDSYGFKKDHYRHFSIKSLQITDCISHIVKPYNCKCDIYEKGICPIINDGLYVETWIRGKRIPETNKVSHVAFVKNGNSSYKESQDHSKWAVSKTTDYIFIGDLNRMTSQFTRGGGGFLIKDPNLHVYFKSLICDNSQK